MELDVKNIIFKSVRDLILARTPGKWVSVSTEIYENLDRLNPTICEDGDIGKIAFGSDDRRMKIKTARFLTRKLHLNSGFLNDVEIRTIQTHIDEILFSDMVQTYISTGSDITKNYADKIGGDSCMAGYQSDCTKLYQDNPDVYSQLIMKQGNASARAMVVRLDNGRYMLDRIYTDAENLIEKMKNYADDQNWVVGYDGDISESGISTYDFIVTGLRYIDGEVPYQDTLRLGRIRDGLLDILYDGCRHDYDFEMGDTEGYIDGENNYASCSYCGCGMSEDETYFYNDGYCCEHCFHERAFTCDHCCEIASKDDSNFIGDEQIYVCGYCVENHYAFCDECGEYFSTHRVQFVESEERYVCDVCLDQHYRECTDCHEFFSELTELEAGDEVCTECREIELQKDISDCIGQLLLPFKDQKCLPSGDYIYGDGVEILLI